MNRHDGGSPAVRSAEAGAQAWRQAVHEQRPATPDHNDFYELAAHLVDTLRALNAVAVVLAGQVEGYADGLGPGRQVYDDTRVVDPRQRLATAALHARHLAHFAREAEADADAFWQAISHIGVEVTS
jgi:hypothetical protein